MRLLPLCIPTVNAVTPGILRAMGQQTADPLALIAVLCPLREAKDAGVLRHFHLSLILESDNNELLMLLKKQRLMVTEDPVIGQFATGSFEDWIDLIIELTQFDESRGLGCCIYATLVSFGMSQLLQKLERRPRPGGMFVAFWGCHQ
jgi:hypothetical protein